MNKTLLLSIIFIFSTELVFSQFGKKKDESNNKLETCGIGFIDDFSSSTNSLFDDSDRLLMTVDALKDRVGNLKDLEKTAAADSVQKIIAEVKLLKVKLLNLKNSSIELYKQVSNIKKRLNELDPLKIDEGAKVLLGTVEKVIKTIANSTKAIKNSIKAMEDLDELTDIDIKVQIDLDELKFSAVSVLIGDVERPELIGAPIVDEFVTASFDLYDTVISISIQATNISNKILKIKKLNPVTVVVEAKSIIEDLIKLGRTMWLIKTKSDEIILLAKSMPARAKEVGIKKAPKALKNIAVATKAVAFAAKEIPFQLMELFEIAKLIVKNFDLKIELNMDMFKQIDVYANFVAKPEPMNVEVIDAYIEETYGFYNQVFVMNQRIDSLILTRNNIANTNPTDIPKFALQVRGEISEYDRDINLFLEKFNSLAGKGTSVLAEANKLSPAEIAVSIPMINNAIKVTTATIKKLAVLQKNTSLLLSTEFKKDEVIAENKETTTSTETENTVAETTENKENTTNTKIETIVAETTENKETPTKTETENTVAETTENKETTTNTEIETTVAETTENKEYTNQAENQTNESVEITNSENTSVTIVESNTETSSGNSESENKTNTVTGGSILSISEDKETEEEEVTIETAGNLTENEVIVKAVNNTNQGLKVEIGSSDTELNKENNSGIAVTLDAETLLANFLAREEKFNFNRAALLRTITIPDNAFDLAFNFGADKLALLDTSSNLQFYSISSNSLVSSIQKIKKPGVFTFSPSGKFFVYSSGDDLFVMDSKTFSLIKKIKGKYDKISQIVFSPGEGHVAIMYIREKDYKAQVVVFDIIKEKKAFDIKKENVFAQMSFSADSMYFMSSWLYDMKTEKAINKLNYSAGYKFADNENVVYKALPNGKIGIYNPLDLALIREYQIADTLVTGAHMHQANNKIVTYAYDQLAMWNIDAKDFQCVYEHGADVMSIMYIPEKNLVVSNTSEKIYFWNNEPEDVLYYLSRDSNQIGMYYKYKNTYPGGKYTHVVDSLADKLRYQQAMRENSVVAFEKYLKEAEKQLFQKMALDNIEELEFKQAVQVATLESVNGYINKYPNGRFKNDAAKKLEEVYYLIAEKSQLPTDFYTYFEKYPEGTYTKEAKLGLENAYYKFSLAQNNISGFELYLYRYPTGLYQGEANMRLENLYWKLADSTNNIIHLKKYSARFPNGTNVQNANTRIDQLKPGNERMFLDYLLAGTISDCKLYFEVYPEGKFKNEAKTRMDYLNMQLSLGSASITFDSTLFTITKPAFAASKISVEASEYNIFIANIEKGNLFEAEKYIVENKQLDNLLSNTSSVLIALKNNRVHTAEMLVDFGAGLNFLNNKYQNAMMLAAQSNMGDNLVAKLAAKNINPNQVDICGKTSADIALMYKTLEPALLDTLILNGLNIHHILLTDTFTTNILVLSVLNENTTSIAESLVKADSTLAHQVFRFGITAYNSMDIALGAGNMTAVQLLEKQGVRALLTDSLQKSLVTEIKEYIVASSKNAGQGCKDALGVRFMVSQMPVASMQFHNMQKCQIYAIQSGNGIILYYGFISNALQMAGSSVPSGYFQIYDDGRIKHLSTDFETAMKLIQK